MSDPRLKAAHPGGKWLARPFKQAGKYFAIDPYGTLVYLLPDGDLKIVQAHKDSLSSLRWSLPEPVYEYRAEGLDINGNAYADGWWENIDNAQRASKWKCLYFPIVRRREQGDTNPENWTILGSDDE